MRQAARATVSRSKTRKSVPHSSHYRDEWARSRTPHPHRKHQPGIGQVHTPSPLPPCETVKPACPGS